MRFIRMREVCQLVSYSRAALYRHMRADKFPRPYDLGGGRAVGWLESEVESWICTRVEARDRPEPDDSPSGTGAASRQSAPRRAFVLPPKNATTSVGRNLTKPSRRGDRH